MSTFELEAVKEFIVASSPESKVYVGCDSIVKKDKIVYAVVVVVHIDGNKGCKVFHKTDVERGRVSIKQRMLNEAWRAAEIAADIKEAAGDRIFEVHLDISSRGECGSHVALKDAAGYVLGIVGIEPIFKPLALCASHCADRVVNGS